MSARLSFAFLGVLIAAVPAVARAQTDAEPKRVLVIFGHDRSAPGVVAFADGLKDVVRSDFRTRVQFYEDYLDMDRFDDSSRARELARYFADKYHDFRPAAIVAEGSLALKFAPVLTSTEPITQELVFGLMMALAVEAEQ